MKGASCKVAQPAVCDSALLAAVELEDVLLAKGAECGFVYGAAAQQLGEHLLRQVWRELGDVK